MAIECVKFIQVYKKFTIAPIPRAGHEPPKVYESFTIENALSA